MSIRAEAGSKATGVASDRGRSLLALILALVALCALGPIQGRASVRASLSAEQILKVLRANPGLTLAVKQAILERAEQEGRILYASELSDDALFRMIASDPAAAVIATGEISKRERAAPQSSEQAQSRKLVEASSEGDDHQQTAVRKPRQGTVFEENDTPTVATTIDGGAAGGAPGVERQQKAPRGLTGTLRSAHVQQAVSTQGGSSLTEAPSREMNPAGEPQADQGKSTPERVAGERSMFESRSHPYKNVRALDDLYSRVSEQRPALERFGASIFRNGTGNSDDLPMDMPIGPDYVVGPGDGLKIELWGGVSERLQRVIDHEGRVGLPEVGTVQISGRTLAEVQGLVQTALRTQFRDVRAEISLARLRTVRVYVVGDVERPGAYDISALSTPLNALYAAGGPTDRGSLRVLRHFRGKQMVQEVDVYDLILHGIRAGLARLEPGDTVLVPPIGAEVTVQGMVRRPAVYELRGERNAADALALAGGVLATGTMRHIDIERVETHQKRISLSLDVAENDDAAVETQCREFAIQDGDSITISPILPYAYKTVYVEGHVLKPGKRAWREGLKVTDLVGSYSDLLPEPYRQHAEVVRLEAPDFRPRIIGFSLGAALDGDEHANVALQPFDTVRIYSRYDFEDAPAIQVNGEVRQPGSHVTSGETHLRDAIYLAGGLTPDALLDDVHVFRRLEGSNVRVLSADLRKALDGDQIHNILLLPRDQVLVHRNAAKVDPPVVSVRGEVAAPGRYPLGEGLTAAELVRLAGGLRRGAFTETADLARFTSAAGAGPVKTENRKVEIGKALSGDAKADVLLRDGDVLSIRQISGWEDIGASVSLKGEVAHPGTYGISPGERLSSVIKRAGGFYRGAYPAAAVLTRAQVRELAEKSKTELIQRLELASTEAPQFATGTSAEEQLAATKALRQQQQQILANLRKQDPDGRLVIRISADVSDWGDTQEDVELRNGDAIVIPKRPTFVLVSGQVYNPAAFSFRPGKRAKWYLSKAGGPTQLANEKDVFIIRADGSVVGQGRGWFKNDVLNTKLQPGDTVVVPEKLMTGNGFWRSLFSTAQVFSALAVTAKLLSTF